LSWMTTPLGFHFVTVKPDGGGSITSGGVVNLIPYNYQIQRIRFASGNTIQMAQPVLDNGNLYYPFLSPYRNLGINDQDIYYASCYSSHPPNGLGLQTCTESYILDASSSTPRRIFENTPVAGSPVVAWQEMFIPVDTSEPQPIEIEFQVVGRAIDADKFLYQYEPLIENSVIPFEDIIIEATITNNTENALWCWELRLLNMHPNEYAPPREDTTLETFPWLLRLDGDLANSTGQYLLGKYETLYNENPYYRFYSQWGSIGAVDSETNQATLRLMVQMRHTEVETISYQFTALLNNTDGDCTPPPELTLTGEAPFPVPIVTTHLDFNKDADQGGHRALRSAIFWSIFNETSEDEYTSGNIADVWSYQELINNEIVIQTIYHPEAYPNGLPSHMLSENPVPNQNYRHYLMTRFLTEETGFCNPNGNRETGNNDLPDEQTHEQTEQNPWNQDASGYYNIEFVTHCNYTDQQLAELNIDETQIVNGDHRYFMAQTALNGMLEYERNPTRSREGFGIFDYFTSNFKGSLGNDCARPDNCIKQGNPAIYDLWEVTDGTPVIVICPTIEGVWNSDDWYVWRTIPVQISGSETPDTLDDTFLNPPKTYKDALYISQQTGNNYYAVEWLHRYLQCMIHRTDDLPRRAVFRQAYDNIMREVNNTIYTLDVDPIDGKFSVKDANLNIPDDVNTEEDESHRIIETPAGGTDCSNDPTDVENLRIVVRNAYTAHITGSTPTIQTRFHLQQYAGSVEGQNGVTVPLPTILRPVLQIQVWREAPSGQIYYPCGQHQWITKSFQGAPSQIYYYYPR